MKESYFSAITEIIRTGHWLTHQVGLELKEFDISEPQFNVLRILRGKKGEAANVMEIQEKMIQKSSNVTRIIDKLIDKGYVSRKECPENRRKMDIHITSNGLTALLELDKRVESLHTPLMKNISAEEAETISELIKKLRNKQ